jgi:hypothetical protein
MSDYGTMRATLLLALVGLGCGEVSKREEVCTAANEGKTITVIGYVTVDGFSLINSDNEFPLSLRESMRADEEIRAFVKLGEGPNTMQPLPKDEFTQDDIELHLADGSTLGWGDRVAATGELALRTGDRCTLRPITNLAEP